MCCGNYENMLSTGFLLWLINNILPSLAANYVTNLTSDLTSLISDEGLKKMIDSSFERAKKKFVEAYGYEPPEICMNLSSINNDDDNISKIINNDKTNFIQYLKDELRNNQQSYLWLIERLICNQRESSKLSRLLEYDEREKYKDRNDFYNIYQGSNIKIDELFIEPNYCGYNYDPNTLAYDEVQPRVKIEIFCESLLNTNKVLFIFGHFGSGKTFLSKRILNKIDDGFTCFFEASRISAINDDLFTFFDSPVRTLINRYAKCYLFIDSLDDIINQSDKVLTCIKDLNNKYDNLFFVVNSRKPDGLNISDILFNLSYTFGDRVGIVELKRFNNKQQKQWIDLYNSHFYNSIENNYSNSITIDSSEFESANKNLKVACQIPLVLLMLLESKGVNLKSKKQKWYKLFESFVNNTIRGKFNKESSYKPFLNDRNVVSEYKAFINEIAISILKKSSFDFTKKTVLIDDYFLDPNDSLYTIEENQVKSIVVKNLKDENPSDLDIISYLNCYFFDCYNHKWKFKDNNILFFLCATQYYTVLQKIEKEYYESEGLEPCANNLHKVFDNLPLHPIVVEFIINKIEDLSNKDRDALLSFIRLLIEKNYIINVPDKDIFKIDYKKIRTDILLVVIFIRFNNDSYQNKLNHCFKRISQYYSFVKIVDKDLASIILRYFRYVPVNDAELRRINYKGFNWNFSKLNNVKFIQCKFQKTPMEDVLFNNVFFNSCYLYDTIIKNSGGVITFNLCHILNSNFIFTKEFYSNLTAENLNGNITVLYFYNCIIDKVEIHLGNNKSTNKAPLIKLEKCDIRQLNIYNGSIKIKIDTSSYMKNKINIDNVHVIDVNSTMDMVNNILLDNLKKFPNFEDWLNSLFAKKNRSKLTINDSDNNSYDDSFYTDILKDHAKQKEDMKNTSSLKKR